MAKFSKRFFVKKVMKNAAIIRPPSYPIVFLSVLKSMLYERFSSNNVFLIVSNLSFVTKSDLRLNLPISRYWIIIAFPNIVFCSS